MWPTRARNSISQFQVSVSGALRPLKPATVASGPFPNAIAVSPNGNAYVVDAAAVGTPANEISQYSINPITGDLTPKSPATVATKNAYINSENKGNSLAIHRQPQTPARSRGCHRRPL
ncbi:MAG TPA: hypothetical protein VHV75_02955 [Solirubrobacteraceae bacterium]|jgi:6-phosphogluconolactonase (cycloisomerase 2 family)|nr:hypothetical protein [Solirubrobacteraceae bacterium]